MKKENKPVIPIPNPDMEYVFYGNYASVDVEYRLSYPIKKKQIVKNVKLIKDSRGYKRYEFEIKETGEILYTDYGNNFYENTPENIKSIKEAKKLDKKIDELKKEIELITLKVRHL